MRNNSSSEFRSLVPGIYQSTVNIGQTNIGQTNVGQTNVGQTNIGQTNSVNQKYRGPTNHHFLSSPEIENNYLLWQFEWWEFRVSSDNNTE